MNGETKILRIDPQRLAKGQIGTIADILRKGGVMAYPTDTFYGLGANCFSRKAVQRIYRLKKRGPSKPLSVLVSDRDMVRSLALEIPSLFWELTEEFWPGPLTLVLKASSALPGEMRGPGDSVGIRMPGVSWLQDLISEMDFPITATSANISGEKEIEDPQRVRDVFSGKVDLIVDGGKTGGIQPSTVVDISSSKLEILREGAVPRSRFEKYLKRDPKS
ncbi:MAG: L-threonylcarbamoyladenylate synthase [Candidatus Aminicenantes bacterium]|jgi:L-threonylcarbamoyladenylate synthase